jgi:plasmid stabilization system protein ParE
MGRQTTGAAATYKVRLSDNAVQNLDEITNYIAQYNQQPLNAIKVGNAIFATIDRIERQPYRFKECSLLPTQSNMYRQALCLSWYIIYKIIDVDVTILGIIHVARKPSKRKALRRIK